MLTWLRDRKKAVIIAVIVAGLAAATGIPTQALSVVVGALYDIVDAPPAPVQVVPPEKEVK